MSLSASIMAHPARKQYVDELLEVLGTDVPVSWDTVEEPSSIAEQRWATGRQAWLMYDPAADWHIVIQDDTIACQDFLAGFANALEYLPDDALIASPYCGTKRPGQVPFTKIAREARRDGAAWLRSIRVWWGVAMACRTETIEPMLEWCDEQIGRPYDSRIGAYYDLEHGSDGWYTWPSLVDHRDGPSLIAHRDAGRHAREFHEGSALNLSWDGPIIDDPRLRQRDVMRKVAERRALKR